MHPQYLQNKVHISVILIYNIIKKQQVRKEILRAKHKKIDEWSTGKNAFKGILNRVYKKKRKKMDKRTVEKLVGKE